MKVMVNIEKEVDVDVTIDDVIAELNLTPMVNRWNHIAKILNEVVLSKEDLDERQRIVVDDFLNRKSREIKLPDSGNSERKDNFVKADRDYEGFSE